jgi:hypothetical protein
MKHLHPRLAFLPPRHAVPRSPSQPRSSRLPRFHHVSRRSAPPPPPPPPPVLFRDEPNDHAWLAPWFGWILPGDLSTSKASPPPTVPTAGRLAFSFNGPARIDFTLYVDDPWTDSTSGCSTRSRSVRRGLHRPVRAREGHVLAGGRAGNPPRRRARRRRLVLDARRRIVERVLRRRHGARGAPELPEGLADYNAVPDDEAERVRSR